MASQSNKTALLLLYPLLLRGCCTVFLAASSQVVTSQEYLPTITLSSQLKGHQWILQGPEQDKLTLSISQPMDGMGVLMVRENQQRVFEQAVYQANLLHVCGTKDSTKPSFLLRETMQGIGVQQAFVLMANPNWSYIELPTITDAPSSTRMDYCYKATTDWQINGHSIDCECDFSEIDSQDQVTDKWLAFMGELPRGLYTDSSAQQLAPHRLENSSELAELIVQARTNQHIIFENITQGNQWLLIEYKGGMYDSLSLDLLHQNQHWSVWYYTIGNSKGFNGITEISQPQESILAAELCVDACDWWGSQAYIEVNLATRQLIRLVED
jgi:hypothetical protein